MVYHWCNQEGSRDIKISASLRPFHYGWVTVQPSPKEYHNLTSFLSISQYFFNLDVLRSYLSLCYTSWTQIDVHSWDESDQYRATGIISCFSLETNLVYLNGPSKWSIFSQDIAPYLHNIPCIRFLGNLKIIWKYDLLMAKAAFLA